MTTLGIRNVAEALRHEFGLTDDQVMNVLAPALWVIHDKATEAAALKCEATGGRPAMALSESIVEAYNNACEDCAAAIRGGKL